MKFSNIFQICSNIKKKRKKQEISQNTSFLLYIALCQYAIYKNVRVFVFNMNKMDFLKGMKFDSAYR